MKRIELKNEKGFALRLNVDHITGYVKADWMTSSELTAVWTTGREQHLVKETPEEIDRMIDNPHLY